MARRASRAEIPARTLPEWLASPWAYLVVALGLGVLASQAVLGRISTRYTKALGGAVFAVALLRLPLYLVTCLYLIAFPFPTYIFIGNTNVIFVLFMLVIWAIRVRLGTEPVPPRTFLDFAAGLYIGIHLLSLWNVTDPANVLRGIQQTVFLGGAVGLYFVVAKILRTERHIRLAMQAMTVTALLVTVTGVAEYFAPNVRLIPDGFIATGPVGERYGEGGRLGGVFGFHGLLADFCAVMVVSQVYLFVRSTRWWARAFYLVLIVAEIFQIFATANRGGFVALVFGLLYLLWIGRGSIRMRHVVMALPLLLGVGLLLDILTERYGRFVALVWRLMTTQFVRGIPDTRIAAWLQVIGEIPNHLWIGHGPFYDLGAGTTKRYWPHSAYLMYLWTTGIVGLSVFLWILGKTIWKTFPGGKLLLKRITFAHGAMAVAHVQVLQFAMGQTRDEHQRGNVFPYLMWALIGLAVASHRVWNQQRAEAARVPEGTGPAVPPPGDPGRAEPSGGGESGASIDSS